MELKQIQKSNFNSRYFLNGKLFTGEEKEEGGRIGDKPSIKLADFLLSLDLKSGRLKTAHRRELDPAQ